MTREFVINIQSYLRTLSTFGAEISALSQPWRKDEAEGG
jgi:hypothetical protein